MAGQAFVAGDPRGHRLAKVLRVARHDVDFPIRIDSQEMCVPQCRWLELSRRGLIVLTGTGSRRRS